MPASMMTTLRQRGSDAFLLTAFAGRLPASMVQLGLLMVVSSSGRGMSVAGTTVACVGVGSAVGAPIVGRLVDRLGPWRVVAGALLIQLLSMVMFWLAIVHGWSAWMLLAAAAWIGAANPQVGSIARARWSALGRRDPDRMRGAALLRQALGYETAADEVGFVVGPVVAGIMVSLLGGPIALMVMMVMTVLGEGAFVVFLVRHPLVEEQGHEHHGGEQGRSFSSSLMIGLIPLALMVMMVGIVFGSTQTALTAAGNMRGTQTMTGPIYGLVGVGSACAGILSSHWHAPRMRVMMLGGVVVCAGTYLMMMTSMMGLTVIAAVVMGTGVGTVLVSAYQGAEHRAPSAVMTTVMTLMATCLVLGVSAGAAFSGAIVTPWGVRAAFMPPVIAGGVIVVIAMMGRIRDITVKPRQRRGN